MKGEQAAEIIQLAPVLFLHLHASLRETLWGVVKHSMERWEKRKAANRKKQMKSVARKMTLTPPCVQTVSWAQISQSAEEETEKLPPSHKHTLIYLR